jgi:hypothetical protein
MRSSIFVALALTGCGARSSLDVGSGAIRPALRTDGSVLCWGRNEFGQLGDGTTTHRPSPTPVPL